MVVAKPIFDGLHWYTRKRNVVCLLAFFGYFMVNIIQINITFAIVPMTNPTIAANGTYIMAEFPWDSTLQGHILSSFYYGHAFGQIAGGWLSARFGGHLIMATSVCLPAIMTLLMPLTVKLGAGGVIAARVLTGLLMSPFYPACNQLWAEWSPPLERSGFVAFSLAGSSVGGIILMSVGGLLAEKIGWPSLFYLTGVSSLLWTLIWIFLIRKSPATDKFINEKEIHYIQEEIKKSEIIKDPDQDTVPWLKLCTSIPLWAIAITTFGAAWCFNTILNALPSYLKNVLKFNLDEVGYMSALPFVAFLIFMTSSGYLADKMISKEILTTKSVRKIWICSGLIVQSICFLLLFVIPNRYGKVASLTIAVGCNSIAFGGLIVNTLDLNRIHAGIILGIVTTSANTSGILSSIFTGYMIQDDFYTGWLVVVFVMVGISIFVSVIFGLFASGEQQDWSKKK